MYYGFEDMFLDMITLWLIPIIFILIIVISMYMIRKNNINNNKIKNSRALKILDERFASGEIDEEEYKKKKDHLRQ